VVPDKNVELLAVEHPEQVPLATATARTTSPELVVTGTVNPDVSRSVPVVSLVSGRVVAIHARVGDTVKKGQLLLSLRSDDVANGFSDYRKAVADETWSGRNWSAPTIYSDGAPF
jgi:cobalt-zinc-cadmium efflux system membrane fusion protein